MGLSSAHSAHLAEGEPQAEHASLLRCRNIHSQPQLTQPQSPHELQVLMSCQVMMSTTHATVLRKRVPITQGVSAGPKMLAAHTNMSESLDGDAEQPSCGTGDLRRSAHPMGHSTFLQAVWKTPCRTWMHMRVDA